MPNVPNSAPYDVDTLRRREFSWAGETIYMDCASTGPLPERTRRALEHFIARARVPVDAHRDVVEIPREARRRCAELIGADASEIALGFNTTFGINLAATGLPLAPGDRVLLLDGDFPANVYPWLNLRRQSVAVELIPRRADGLPDEAALVERLARGDVSVVSVSAVNFCTGYRVDLETISSACRRHGSYLVVDGIQALGVLSFDVKETPIDVLACGGQKWLLSPHGSGFAYVRGELIEQLQPSTVGWLAYRPSWNFGNLLDYRLDPVEGASRFELGSLVFSSLVGLNRSLALLLELGIDRIEEHVRDVQEPLVRWASSRPDVDWMSDLAPERRSGILTFRAPDPERLYRMLSEAGVSVSVREGGIRVSVHCFNSRGEMERVVELLEVALSDGGGGASE